MLDPEIYVSTGLVGAGVGLGTFFGREYYFQGLDFVEKDLGEKLRSLRIVTKRLRAWLILWSIGLVALLVGLGYLLDSLALALTFAVLLACLPWYVIRRMALSRKAQIESQLADAMVTFSSAIKAGLSLAQAMDILAGQCPRPVSDEFRQIVGEYQMGKPLERTLTEAKERLRSDNFSLFAAALLASRKSGGRLNETVDRIAHSVLELQRLERKIMVETAQARRSAIYMAMVPVLLLGVYYFVDPINTVLLFTTVPGQILLSIAIALVVIAYVWAQVILRPEI
ncbi:MAG TPA: type II secretion system F family protein [Pirellulaceae bacterium]|jgi:tight adherence protein B|nr:type II secretion system F family protein [Pirellulaceae bacterium]